MERVKIGLKESEKIGSKILSMYFTLGRYDCVIVSDCPDEKVHMKIAMQFGDLAISESMVAVPAEEATTLIDQRKKIYKRSQLIIINTTLAYTGIVFAMPSYDVYDEAIIDAPHQLVYKAIIDEYRGTSHWFQSQIEYKLRGEEQTLHKDSVIDILIHRPFSPKMTQDYWPY